MTTYSIAVSSIENARVRRAVICATLPFTIVAQIVLVVLGCAGMFLAILVAAICTKHGQKLGSQYLRRFLLWVYWGLGLDKLVESARRVW